MSILEKFMCLRPSCSFLLPFLRIRYLLATRGRILYKYADPDLRVVKSTEKQFLIDFYIDSLKFIKRGLKHFLALSYLVTSVLKLLGRALTTQLLHRRVRLGLLVRHSWLHQQLQDGCYEIRLCHTFNYGCIYIFTPLCFRFLF